MYNPFDEPYLGLKRGEITVMTGGKNMQYRVSNSFQVLKKREPMEPRYAIIDREYSHLDGKQWYKVVVNRQFLEFELNLGDEMDRSSIYHDIWISEPGLMLARMFGAVETERHRVVS